MFRALSIFTLLIAICFLPSFAENKTITGFIFDKESGKTLAGATIRVPGTNLGTF